MRPKVKIYFCKWPVGKKADHPCSIPTHFFSHLLAVLKTVSFLCFGSRLLLLLYALMPQSNLKLWLFKTHLWRVSVELGVSPPRVEICRVRLNVFTKMEKKNLILLNPFSIIVLGLNICDHAEWQQQYEVITLLYHCNQWTLQATILF